MRRAPFGPPCQDIRASMARMHILRHLARWAVCLPFAAAALGSPPTLSPAPQATGVNPDALLAIGFESPPTVGSSGLIRIYDADSRKLIDTLDLAVPTSPNPSGRFPPASSPSPSPSPSAAASGAPPVYQWTRIAGHDFHFRPVIVHGKVATIYPHHGVLSYGRRYRVTMDPGVLQLSAGHFAGIDAAMDWTFSTRAAPPPADSTRLVVAADGSGDFNTVQGAIDFVPDRPARRITIFIRDGFYEEIVSLAAKSKLVLRGEHREGVKVGYANNSAFNFDGRWAFSIIDGSDIQLSGFTINNYAVGQAEALLSRGERIVLSDMTLKGSGDALTTYGTLYVADSKITGHGDTVLGYGAAYFVRSELHSIGAFTWTRTPAGSHGNVFVDCTFIADAEPLPWTAGPGDAGRRVLPTLARLPHNHSATALATNYPHAEMVLIDTRTQGIPPEGWGPIEDAPDFDSSQVHFWEFNTRDLAGQPIDAGKRHPVARQLTQERDAATIADYRRPEFVLGGWKPVVE